MYGLFELQRYGQERVLKVRWLKGNGIELFAHCQDYMHKMQNI
jgi:hypothetical protein